MDDLLRQLGITEVKILGISYNVKDYLSSKIYEGSDDKAKDLLALLLYDILIG